MLQQVLFCLRLVGRIAERAHLRDQRQGALLDGFDLPENVFLFCIGRAGDHVVERLRSACVIGSELVDRLFGGVALCGVVHEYDVAQSNCAVVDAATEIDRVALLDAVDLIDGGELLVDAANALDAHHGQDHHQDDDREKAQGQALSNAQIREEMHRVRSVFRLAEERGSPGNGRETNTHATAQEPAQRLPLKWCLDVFVSDL